MAEEAKRAVSKVHDCRDDNQGYDPVAEVIKHTKTRTDKELDQVVA